MHSPQINYIRLSSLSFSIDRYMYMCLFTFDDLEIKSFSGNSFYKRKSSIPQIKPLGDSQFLRPKGSP
jgi:hypothetical protein